MSNRLGGGSRYYYATDHQGSVIGMFSATGAWLGGYSYSPYGEERSIAGGTAPTTNSLRYIAGYWDSTAGLYRLGARYYDPTTARFTQYDPSGQEANPFAYAACNPIHAKDPGGTSAIVSALTDIGAFAAGGAAIGGVVGCVGGFFAAGVGCLPGAATGAIAGGVVGGAVGILYAVGTWGQGGY